MTMTAQDQAESSNLIPRSYAVTHRDWIHSWLADGPSMAVRLSMKAGRLEGCLCEFSTAQHTDIRLLYNTDNHCIDVGNSEIITRAR